MAELGPEPITGTKLREVFNNQARELENLRQKMENLSLDLKKLSEKYEFLLEQLLETKRKPEIPISNPVPIPQHTPTPAPAPSVFGVERLQVLSLLKESRAISKDFAVTANQLKQAFGIEQSERTLRNKLASLEEQGLVISSGKKPKTYFATPEGIALLEKQRREMLSVRS